VLPVGLFQFRDIKADLLDILPLSCNQVVLIKMGGLYYLLERVLLSR
jgi:hypothetical protein